MSKSSEAALLNDRDLSRLERFTEVMVNDLGSPELRAEYEKAGVQHCFPIDSLAQRMSVDEAYSVKGVKCRIAYESSMHPQHISFPVYPFARSGHESSRPWDDLFAEQVNPEVALPGSGNIVELPQAVCFPRRIRSRRNPLFIDHPEGEMEKWGRRSTVNGMELPLHTYYDGVAHHGLYETWTQLEVVAQGTGTRYDFDQQSGLLGGHVHDGMLTSPSVTFLKLGLWRAPLAKGQVPLKQILFRVHIGDQFINRTPPVPRGLLEKSDFNHNASEQRIKIVPHPAKPAHSLSHRQRLRYGQSHAFACDQ